MDHANRVDWGGDSPDVAVCQDGDVVDAEAFRAVTAPRAVAPKLITAARRRRPYSPVMPISCRACKTEQ
jgi:hypothetical protein